MISLLQTMVGEREKIDKLIELLDIIDYDPKTKTLTINSDITIKVKGDYKMDVDKHLRLNSNYNEEDPELKIPYSIFWNSDEGEFRNIQKQTNNILSDNDDCGCGNH